MTTSQDSATPAPVSLWYDPDTLPAAPLPDDHPLLVSPLPTPEWAGVQQRQAWTIADRAITDSQRRFIHALYWQQPRNVTKAAILAGYSAKNASDIGRSTLKSPHVAQIWSLLNGEALPASQRHTGEHRPPCTREEVAQVLSEALRATPDDYVAVLRDLSAGMSTPHTRSPIYAEMTRRTFQGKNGGEGEKITLKVMDKLGCAKLLADLSGWRVSKDAASGAQAALDEILDAIASQGRGSKPANKPHKPANTDDEDLKRA